MHREDPRLVAEVPADVLEFWVRLLGDEKSKDLELKAKDGSVWVHALMLSNISEPLQAMLTMRLLEHRTKKIDMSTFTKAQLKFVIRFMYTGHVHPEDWGCSGSNDDTMGACPEQPRKKMKIVGSPSGVLEPLAYVSFRPGRLGIYFEWGKGNFPKVHDVQEGSQAEQAGVDIGWSFESIDGEPFSDSLLHTKCEGETPYVVGFLTNGRVPLATLFGGLAFAKLYDVRGLTNVIMSVMRDRLCPSNFNQIMRNSLNWFIARKDRLNPFEPRSPSQQIEPFSF